MLVQEVGKLAHNVHDIGGNQSLIRFALLLLTQIQQLFNHRHDELVLLIRRHRARDGPESPAELIQSVKAEVVAVGRDSVESALNTLVHGAGVDVRQEDQCLPHLLINVNGLDIIYLNLHRVPVLIHFNEHFLRLSHVVQDRLSELIQYIWIDLTMHEATLEECLGVMWREPILSIHAAAIGKSSCRGLRILKHILV